MPRRKARTQQQPRLIRKSDNEAQNCWRQGNSPTAVFCLPCGFDPFEKTAGRNVQRVQSIAHESQAYIVPKQVHGTKGAIDLQIWGTTSQCDTAIREVTAWVDEQASTKGSKRRGRENFPKIQAYFEERQPEILEKLNREERRQQYRQQRLSSVNSFVSVYVLKWAVTDWSLEDVLGNSTEGLDPIRMDCRCYIDFLKTSTNISGGPCFIIAGNKEQKVKTAVERLKNIDKHIMAYSFDHCQFFVVKPGCIVDSKQSKAVLNLKGYAKPMYLLEKDHTEDGAAGMTVDLAISPNRDVNFLDQDEKLAWSIEDIGLGSVSIQARHAMHHVLQYLDLWLISTLEYLPYYAGYLKMRANIGTCVFTSYKTTDNGTYDLLTFEEMLGKRNTQENEMDAYFTDELGDKAAEADLLRRFFASHMFASRNVPFYNAPRERCNPIYRAIFHVEGTVDSPDYRLEIDYKEENNGEYQRDPLRWLRLDSSEDDLTRMLDITLVDLKNSSTSFQLNVSACQILQPAAEAKLPTSYSAFADSVELKLGVARTLGTNNNFFKFSRTGTTLPIPVRKIEQRRCWQFHVCSSPGYIVEVFTTQTCEYTRGTNPKPRDERWGVQVFHEQWDALFNENQTLEIGERTEWEPTESQFFSVEGSSWYEEREGMEFERGSGYAELLQVMEIVERVIISGGARMIGTSKDKGKAKMEESGHIASTATPAAPLEPERPLIKGISNEQALVEDVLGKRMEIKSMMDRSSAPEGPGSGTLSSRFTESSPEAPLAEASFSSQPAAPIQPQHGRSWKPTQSYTDPSKSSKPPAKAGSATNSAERLAQAKAPGSEPADSQPKASRKSAKKGRQPTFKNGGNHPANRSWRANPRPSAVSGTKANEKARAGFDILGEMEV